jgi:ATP-binding cassette subfamily B protein|tara:strand:+ start:2734 stop:4476 length:1743 start_codon:yes stop_codon:yes gene_type:complete
MIELKHLNKYLLKYKFKIIIGIFITIIARIFALVAPNLIGDSITLIENYLFSSDIELVIVKKKLLSNILMIVVSAIIAGIFTFIMRQMLINVSRYIEFDLKNEIYKKYQTLSFDFYKNNRTGDLMNRISEDVSKVRMYIGPAIMYTINTFALFTIVISYMISVAPKLTMYTLIPLPILSFIIYKISIIINLKSKTVQEYLSKLTTYTQESFSGVKIIKTYTVENNINKELNKLANTSREKNMSLVKIQAWFFPLMILLIGISNILVVFIGGRQYMNNEIELGVLAEFIIYVNMLTWPVATVGWVTSIIQQAEASQKRINEFLKTKSSIVDCSKNNIKIEGKIEFKNIEFTYPETQINACKNISFSVKKGKSLAIMGDIGSGKTTLLELLCRIYDPINGEILIDNTNIKNINIKELKNSIGYVPQSTFLFSESIEKNIKFGKNNASLNEVEIAAKNACLSSDIDMFKDGFKTLLGERGVNLSGGQKQRLAIARAIIKRPKILILDDSLSAVDTETEEKILSNINNISKNITLIIATHRISSAKNCDKILIINNGKVLEYGSHHELIKKNGYYSKTLLKQSK